MFSTLGGISMAIGVLLSLLGTVILWKCSRAARALRALKQDLAATQPEKAPPKWATKLLELEAELSSLASLVEKVLREQRKQGQRVAMRELRASQSAARAPPPGTAKTELRKFYNLNGKSHAEIARMALTGVDSHENAEAAGD